MAKVITTQPFLTMKKSKADILTLPLRKTPTETSITGMDIVGIGVNSCV